MFHIIAVHSNVFHFMLGVYVRLFVWRYCRNCYSKMRLVLYLYSSFNSKFNKFKGEVSLAWQSFYVKGSIFVPLCHLGVALSISENITHKKILKEKFKTPQEIINTCNYRETHLSFPSFAYLFIPFDDRENLKALAYYSLAYYSLLCHVSQCLWFQLIVISCTYQSCCIFYLSITCKVWFWIELLSLS